MVERRATDEVIQQDPPDGGHWVPLRHPLNLGDDLVP
jgi:hypothetical protein